MNTKLIIGVVLGVVIIALGVGLGVGLTNNNDDDQPEPTPDPTDYDSTENCLYNACQETKPDKLNIHIVPHSHDDAGWLYTVDKYFEDRVFYAINTVIIELEQNPKRQYIQVEIAFFERWWRMQTEEVQNRVRNLVKNGQLQFALGHWSMPDEAVTYYNDLITNAEIGMRFLEHEFGKCGQPLVGWQIDPFGHSRGVQKLYQKMGYDGWFLGRVDYEDYKRRNSNGQMEFEWNGFWTSINANVYRRPPDFCWDSSCDNDRYNDRGNAFIIDDPELEGYNVEERVNSFIEYVEEHAKTAGYTTNHVMLTMGDDFFYTNADKFFVNLDKLIKYINQLKGDKYHAVYSTPTCYMHNSKIAKESEGKNWPSYEKDFFPYCDGNFRPWVEPTGADVHGYWSGYYASRNQLKSSIRTNSTLLHACNQWETLGLIPAGQSKWLRRTIGLTQHHDAVTGTEKQKVVDDYNHRLERSAGDCLDSLSEHHSDRENADSVVIYNSLGWARTEVVDLGNGDFHEFNLPGFGWVEKAVAKTGGIKQDETKIADSEAILENINLKLTVSDGKINIKNKLTNTEHVILQKWMYYESCNSDRDDCGHNSGAYIFVPKNETPNFAGNFICETDQIGGLACASNEVDYISYTIRLKDDVPSTEMKLDQFFTINYQIGPLPVDRITQNGKEVFSRFEILDKTDESLASVLWTDTNMFGSIDRNRSDIRPMEPTASRYMPITAQASLKFSDGDSFQITTDRAAGVTSLEKTQFDIMLHRRTLKDDGKGLGEAMDDDTGITGSLYVNFPVSETTELENNHLEKFVTYRPLIVYKQSGSVSAAQCVKWAKKSTI